MRSSNSKMIGNGLTSTDTPVENGLPPKEDHNIDESDVQTVAAKVVENVVRLASVAAKDVERRNSPKTKRCQLQSLPTIQIDTVPSPPSSPTELSPVSLQSSEEPLDENHIDINLEEEQAPEPLSDDLKTSLKKYIEDILSKAMTVADEKLKSMNFDETEKEEEIQEKMPTVPQQVPVSEPEEENSGEPDEAEIRAAAEKVVEEVLTKAQDSVIEQMEQFEKEIAALNFPITFDEAPDCVKDVASELVKDVVGKAIAQTEEKAVPTVPFNFEDVDLMKTNGPWYVRVREALVRVLRTACFCTPRRNDS